MKGTLRARRGNGGFTLIELILVTVIIAILAGMVTLSFRGTATDAKIRAALGDIKSYGTAIETYALNNNDQYPDQLSDLLTGKGSIMRDLNLDPWGNPYVYLKPGAHYRDSYDLFSMGPDGARDTEDDVKPWVRPEEEE
ncbi:MAG: type II secretion system protein GspG [Candidatus Hydrogenedentes bacterium]|nr:type II secretion system protein GspG [Candidatus Hydrogenedentota bacterium]